MSCEYSPLVAKFGGTSMADPERVRDQLERPGNNADVVIVSAPGKAPGHDVKMTDMLIVHQENPIGRVSVYDIQARYAEIAHGLDSKGTNQAVWDVVYSIPEDIAVWQSSGAPLAALGEHWSAKLFAAHAGREFVDARDIIRFTTDGKLALDTTVKLVRGRLRPGSQYVVPGFYGSDEHGRIHVFDRGGSDTTGAVIAYALGAAEYHNWSDVPGFMTADPRIVPNASLLPHITYREAREMANGGSQLLHPAVARFLGHTDIETHMRHTMSSDNDARRTRITRTRAWEDMPIIGVSGQAELVELSVHEFGIHEQVGTTEDIFTLLRQQGIPYLHAATGTDDVSVIMDGSHWQRIEQPLDHLQRQGRTVGLGRIGLVHVVGEGLVRSGIERGHVIGRAATALATAGIESLGTTDVARSASLTLFVPSELAVVQAAIRTVHAELMGR